MAIVWDQNAVKVFLRKLYKELASEHTRFSIRRMKGIRGLITWEEDEEWEYYDKTSPAHIEIDHRDALIPTLIHECLHRIYPTWTEEMVMSAEAKIAHLITARQAKNIIKKFAESL